MAKLIPIGNVIDSGSARRLDTKRLRKELNALRDGAGLAYARSGRGGYDVWIEANENIGPDSQAEAVSAAVAQAERLRITLP